MPKQNTFRNVKCRQAIGAYIMIMTMVGARVENGDDKRQFCLTGSTGSSGMFQINGQGGVDTLHGR